MSRACSDLLDYAVRSVTAGDVAEFAPNDPGYPNYVRTFVRLLEDHDRIQGDYFDLTETIGLTWWSKASGWADADRFRRFRTFTNAVGMTICVAGDDDGTMPGNYFAASLVGDAVELRDRVLLALLAPAFEDFHRVLRREDSEESVFVLLGLLLVKAELDAPAQNLSDIAERIMVEKSAHSRLTPKFLWGSTWHSQMNKKWKRLVAQLLVPSTENTLMLREALLSG